MRVLHFMNTSLDISDLELGSGGINASGVWMAALLARMIKTTDFAIGCVAFGDVREIQRSSSDRVDSFIVPGDLVGRSLNGTLSASQELVDQWKPDLIHVHGTESAYGLLSARKMVECPALISLQGLLGPCSEWYHYFGNHGLLEIAKMHRWLEIPAMRGHWMKFIKIRQMASREREIIAGNIFFMGRTAWDHAYISSINSGARYFHGGEILREAFWQNRWNIAEAIRHRVIFTNIGGYPRKGVELLLEAVRLLKSVVPDIQVCLAGNISTRSGYGKYLQRKIDVMGDYVIKLGQLDASEMVKELLKSHVFVSPSFIDNSPNSVCEAQLVGMPVISTYTGGVPSLVEEGRTGLFFPTGDAPMLASRLREIFENDDLAVRLGNQAHEVAVKRHDPDAIISDVVSAYNEILGISG